MTAVTRDATPIAAARRMPECRGVGGDDVAPEHPPILPPKDPRMDVTTHCPLAITLAARLRASREELTGRWLVRIAERVSLRPNRVFPTEDLLDHMPLLLLGIADYLENPAMPVSADPPVIAKAMELGALRHSQGFDQHEILKEYELLGGILYAFLASIVDEIELECTRPELLVCAQRVFLAIALIQQATTTQYLRLARADIAEREERLRSFHRTLTHEFRNRLGAAMGAARILEENVVSPEDTRKLAGVVARNTDSMRVALENLVELSRVEVDARRQRHVRLPEAAAEAARQLRDAARVARVQLRVAPELPDVEVSAAAIELALTNLISNAIKYSDPRKAERWVEVRGHTAENGITETIVEVADNGVGVAEPHRARLFERFFRAPSGGTVTGSEGTGLGLSIVRETIEALGGRVFARFPDEGAVFGFALPARRHDDPQ